MKKEKKRMPWYYTHLTKKEREGKSLLELAKARKKAWIAGGRK